MGAWLLPQACCALRGGHGKNFSLQSIEVRVLRNRMERFLGVAPALKLRHEQQEGVRGDSRAVVLNL